MNTEALWKLSIAALYFCSLDAWNISQRCSCNLLICVQIRTARLILRHCRCSFIDHKPHTPLSPYQPDKPIIYDRRRKFPSWLSDNLASKLKIQKYIIPEYYRFTSVLRNSNQRQQKHKPNLLHVLGTPSYLGGKRKRILRLLNYMLERKGAFEGVKQVTVSCTLQRSTIRSRNQKHKGGVPAPRFSLTCSADDELPPIRRAMAKLRLCTKMVRTLSFLNKPSQYASTILFLVFNQRINY